MPRHLTDDLRVKSVARRAADDALREVHVQVDREAHLDGGSEDFREIFRILERVRVDVQLRSEWKIFRRPSKKMHAIRTRRKSCAHRFCMANKQYSPLRDTT
mmetsp:Transcript_14458/g.31441  ORF Transcript_14458/g.31441 Transcript_14458/m.31441 type:complete len:102 (-) Transcript_14458:102-407(-)